MTQNKTKEVRPSFEPAVAVLQPNPDTQRESLVMAVTLSLLICIKEKEMSRLLDREEVLLCRQGPWGYQRMMQGQDPRENGLDTSQVLCVLMFTRRCVPNVTICKSTVCSELRR